MHADIKELLELAADILTELGKIKTELALVKIELGEIKCQLLKEKEGAV